jgi:hypothetical protein
MGSLMVGYDMIVAISQNEVNSQFERLARTGYIASLLKSNGVSMGGLFGGPARLQTYLRGGVSAPQVAFGKRNNAQEVEFSFTFVARDEAPSPNGDFTQAELEDAFDPKRGATDTDGLLVRSENIQTRDPKTGEPVVLTGQRVFYWLRRRTARVGTTATRTYSLVPAIYLVADGQPVLVSLEGLALRFAVQLNKIPATAQDFEAGVNAKKIPKEILNAIHEHKFTEGIFSLEQLFLDFDSVDFTQWDLKDPARGLGATVSLAAPNDDGSYAFRLGVSLTDLTEQDPQFSIELSANLQDIFGVQGKNPAGSTPYILGVTVAQTKPADGPAASLVPTWIGYSSNPNAKDPGLSTVNYEVLGGKNPEQRVPRNQDKSVRHLATALVSSNDFSGTLLFARSAFFDPLVRLPVEAALATGVPWQQNGTNFVSNVHEKKDLDPENHVTDTKIFGKYGYRADVFQEDTHAYAVKVDGSRVTVRVDLHRRVRLEAKVYVSYGDLDFWWQRDFTGSTEAVFEAYVDTNQQIRFKVTPPPDIRINMAEDRNSLSGAADEFLSALETIAMRNFNPAAATLNDLAAQTVANFRQHADALKAFTVHSSRTRFISPTGQVFLLNRPRYDGELNLQMDVTYSVLAGGARRCLEWSKCHGLDRYFYQARRVARHEGHRRVRLDEELPRRSARLARARPFRGSRFAGAPHRLRLQPRRALLCDSPPRRQHHGLGPNRPHPRPARRGRAGRGGCRAIARRQHLRRRGPARP